ncbi:MAG: histidine kinase N-terminal 7TM domain-containing protein [Halobacteriales archaeon]|nr:histidine kinase N-terminal 7TM domain-containing protein [Halobacteriales archaeon]
MDEVPTTGDGLLMIHATVALYLLVFVSFLAVFSLYPYITTALPYRQRDNGLAYILLVLGMALWNGMAIAQLLSPRLEVKAFFLSLAIVGALQAGLGWFLFAGTASSTPEVPYQRILYGGAAMLIGIDIVLAMTSPVHTVYWVLPEATSPGFAVIVPRPAYWLHTLLLVGLFAAGVILFGIAWREGVNVGYTRAYTLIGALLVVAILASNVLTPGGLSVAPQLAFSLATIGWLQANRGGVQRLLRSVAPGRR